MFRTERQGAILEEVERIGRVSTAELAKRYDVSEDSIRKDLQQLGTEGKIRRVYGGAVPVESEAPKRVVIARLDDYRAQKEEIARKAYGLIEDGQTIFLDISSTNLYLADLIASGNKRLVVVSNMLDVVKRVADGKNVEAQCPGGKMNLELSGLVGATTADMLRRIRFDLSFLGTLELDVDEDAVSTFDMEDGTVKQTVLYGSNHAFIVADSHKFHSHGSYRYARMSDFEGLITDEGDMARREAVASLGMRVI